MEGEVSVEIFVEKSEWGKLFSIFFFKKPNTLKVLGFYNLMNTFLTLTKNRFTLMIDVLEMQVYFIKKCKASKINEEQISLTNQVLVLSNRSIAFLRFFKKWRGEK